MAKPANCEGFALRTTPGCGARTRSWAAARGPPVHHGRPRSCEFTGKPRLFHLRSARFRWRDTAWEPFSTVDQGLSTIWPADAVPPERHWVGVTQDPKVSWIVILSYNSAGEAVFDTVTSVCCHPTEYAAAVRGQRRWAATNEYF